MLFVCIMLFLPFILKMLLSSCSFFAYWHIVCYFKNYFALCTVHSVCWFFLILCSHRFMNERATCSLEKLHLKITIIIIILCSVPTRAAMRSTTYFDRANKWVILINILTVPHLYLVCVSVDKQASSLCSRQWLYETWTTPPSYLTASHRDSFAYTNTADVCLPMNAPRATQQSVLILELQNRNHMWDLHVPGPIQIRESVKLHSLHQSGTSVSYAASGNLVDIAPLGKV